MKLFKAFSTRSKIALAAVLTVAAVAVPAVTMAGLGSERPVKAYQEGMQGFDHVTFNSFTGVPGIGDERDFFTGMVGTDQPNFYDPMNDVRGGDELLVRIYIHNNADSSKNADGSGVAKNTRVRVDLPTGMNQNQVASAFISADNAQPKVIEDTLSLTANTPVSLQYVPGSANIKSLSGSLNTSLSDDIVSENGVVIGSEQLNGDYKGCFEYVASVTFKVKVTAPGYQFQKNVRVSGTQTFTDEVTAKPGDKVDFNLGFKNSGTTDLKNVVIGDRLPVGLTYVPGSTEWNSHQTGQKWTKITNDEWMRGGLGVGSFLQNATVLVRFSATVDDASKLQCGLNQVINHGFAKAEGQSTIQDSATVKVTRECAETPTTTPTPVYSCGLLEVEKGEGHTVTVKNFEQVAKDGAAFKHVVLQWGDGKAELTDNAAGKTHTYAADGNYTVRAIPTFTVNGQDVAAGESAACAKTVSFTAPVDGTPEAPAETEVPTELAAAGAGSVIAVFATAASAGAVLYRLFLGRKYVR
ncbi:MAG TPA: DUF11 domain-containing protein [Candidatus Saccharimonadales bacterium]|nr:DUF11 domain-containing protein [Candidatus Saccharimonadales bacterium]